MTVYADVTNVCARQVMTSMDKAEASGTSGQGEAIVKDSFTSHTEVYLSFYKVLRAHYTVVVAVAVVGL